MKKKKNICAPCHSLKSKPARGTSLLLFVYDQPVLDSLLVQFLPCIISDIDCYLLLIKRMELYCGFVINCFFFFSFYKFRKKKYSSIHSTESNAEHKIFVLHSHWCYHTGYKSILYSDLDKCACDQKTEHYFI